MYGSFDLTIPLASSTPFVPSFRAAATSSPLVIPAPHRMVTFGFISLTRFIVFVTISGFAFETSMPVPISSGGSTANIFGFKVATAALTSGLFAHAHVISSTFLALLIIVAISLSVSCLSEWFIKVPIAPASLTALQGCGLCCFQA
jgi:hypothetical protein